MKKIVLSLFLYSITAYAAPEGFELISGQATAPQINAQGQIQIQSTQDSVVHWNSFSLNPQEVLVFDQAQETSSILNRVVGSDPSEILGKIQSNGMVYLINQNGILIGPGGVIETAGFLASTLDVLNTDFFTKNTLEFFSKNPGSIINLGTISCPVGQVTLLAQSIENQGEIDGSLQAVTCTKATLQIDNQRVFIQTNQEIDTPDSFQSLSKSIQKNPYAHAIKHSGRITANTLGVENGRIYLFAQEGTTEITGSVEASDIKLLGKEVLLKEQAIIDASSDTQGGKVLIGGGYKGQDIDIPLAEHVLIDSEVQIHADAKQTGNGGEIIIWSEENTGFLGFLSAKGGDLSGDGGFIEVSGKKGLTFEGLVDLTAAHGKTGYLLIDPDNINIIPTGTDSATGQTFNTIGNVTISGNNISSALNSANLVLQANLDIVIGDNIIDTSANNLTLQAGGNITSSGGPFTLQLNGGDFTAIFNDAGAANSGGAASFVANNLTINTFGGKIVIQQGSLGNSFQGGILLTGTLLDARTLFNVLNGPIELSLNPNNNGQGIKLDASNIGGGDIVLRGIGSDGIDCNQSLINADASIHAIGTAKANDKPGINLVNSRFSSKRAGDISLNGQAADSSGLGISLSSFNPPSIDNRTFIDTKNGSITLNSFIGSIKLDDATIFCSGSGVVTVNSQQDFSLLSSRDSTTSAVAIDSGIADFTIGRDLTLTSTAADSFSSIETQTSNVTGGSLKFTVGRNVSLLTDNSSSFCLIGWVDTGTPTPANITVDILFNHIGGDLTLQGANNIGSTANGLAQIGHHPLSSSTEPRILNGNISLLVDGSISLVGGSASDSSYAQIGHGAGIAPFTTTGQITAIAGKNIMMQSNTGSANITNAGGDITLVTNIGSIQLDNARIVCEGSGVLRVNSQQDCSLLSSRENSKCRMTVMSGIADFTIGRDLTLTSTGADSFSAIGIQTSNLTGGSLQFTVGRNVSLLTDNSSSFCLIGCIDADTPTPANITGDILFNHIGGDLTLQGANNIGPGNAGFARIGHLVTPSVPEPGILNGNISLLVDGSISLVGGSASQTSAAYIGHSGDIESFTRTGQITAIAGKNIVMKSNTGSADIANAGGDITLVTNIGSIQLENANIFCGGSGVLRVNSQQDCSLLSSRESSNCTMTALSGIADFTIGRDLTLTSTAEHSLSGIGNVRSNPTGGSLKFTVGRNVSLLTDNSSSACLIGCRNINISIPANITGDILFNHIGGDLTLQGANNIAPVSSGFAQIGHLVLTGSTEPSTLNGNIFLLVDGSISLVGGSASETSYAQIGHGGLGPFTTTGQLTAIAGKNIVMKSNTGSANIINKGGGITLVTDNLFPVSPLIGPGFFSINSTVSAGGELRIYTAARSQNQINDLINGSPFTPGTLFVDSNQEIWATYYPGGGYGGGPFTIYYKNSTIEPPIVPPIVPPIEVIEETFQFAVDQAELSTMLQNFYIVNPPIYQAKLDYFSQRELMCFDPYRRVLGYRVNQRNLTR